MKDFEREEANINELEQIGEFVNFDAEDFKSKEEYLNNNEEYKVKETQPQSFIDNEEKTIKRTKDNSESITKKLKNLNSNIASSSASSTVSFASVAAVTVTAAVGVGVIDFPLDNQESSLISSSLISSSIESTSVISSSIESTSESSSENIPINYGKFEFINYKVDVHEIEDGQEIVYQKDIYLYFDEELLDGYNVRAIDNSNDQVFEYNFNSNYILLNDISFNTSEIEVQILNSLEDIIDKYIINVQSSGSIEYQSELPMDYIITYNENDTCNLYYYPIIEYENYTFSNELRIYDLDNNKLDYTFYNSDGIYYIENINENEFNIQFSTYLIEDNNYYLIANNKLDSIKPYDIGWTASAELNNLEINIYEEIVDKIKVSVQYLSDDVIEEFVIYKNDINNNVVNVELSRIEENINVIIEGEFSKYSETPNIINYKGTLNKYIKDSLEINPNIYSYISLNRIEVLNDSYGYDGAPTNIYFDGYIKEGDYLNVNIYDSSASLINRIENINSTKERIQFNDLDTTQDLRLEYILYNSFDEEISKNEYQFSAEIPKEYLGSSFNFNSLNPNSIYLTYNEDSFNAYFYMNYSNESEYDFYYNIELYNTLNFESEEPIDNYLSNDMVAYFEDLSYEGSYCVKYGALIKEGLVYYACKDLNYPSGSFEVTLEDGVNRNGYLGYENTTIENVYILDLIGKVYSDIEVSLIIDNNDIETLTIPLNDITYENLSSTFELDLSKYTYSEVQVEVRGLINTHIELEEEINNYIQVKGNKGIDTILSTTIFK